MIFDFLKEAVLPDDRKLARKIAAMAPSYAVISGILYFIDSKRRNRKRALVPRQLREDLMRSRHSGPFGGHFATSKVYGALADSWYWEGMYQDVEDFCRNCPQCVIVSGCGRHNKPPLHPIPVQRPFQIVGVDIMDLPTTQQGNKHVVVFQDFFTKWPLVYPVPDQKATTLVQLLTKEVIPFFGVPEALLSDRGANLLSHLMRDVCGMLGIEKLNTTAYHPECNGMVERFNRTLKSMLRKHADQFGCQWDEYLSSLLWAYRNMPHDTTGEKPSFLLFGFDCRAPTEAAFLPPSEIQPVEVSDYREELMLSLSSARQLACENIRKVQQRYKRYYDRKTTPVHLRVGQWVLVRFPQEESGRQRKLSRPWHGPYRVISRDDPDVTVSNVYFPGDSPIQIHQSRVTVCPDHFPAGFYWYGKKRRGPGRPPKWVEQLLDNGNPMELGDDPCSDESGARASDLEDSDLETNVEQSTDSREQESSPLRAETDRYSLRRRVSPPDRLMCVKFDARDEHP